MNNTTINNILKYTIIGGLFITLFIPLIAPSDPGANVSANNIFFFANHFFFPFITSKAFVFRIIVEVVFFLWLGLILRDKSYLPKFSWLSIAITSFAVVTLIADLLGVNPLRSIWSNFERMEGWMMIIHIWAYFMVLASVLNDRKMWHRFFNVSLFVAFCISIYGIVQLTGHAEIHQGSTRLDASLGNAIYLAVYMLFHVFLSTYLFFVSWTKKKSIGMWIYGVLAVFFAFIVFETQTRGTILGLIAGVMLSLLIYAIWGKNDKRGRYISGGVLVFIVLLGLLFYFNRNASFIQHNGTLQRLASISWSETQTQARAYIWPMAIKGAFQNPKTAIIGWGQENFNYIFNANYNPLMWHQEQWFDRAHNIYLDWLTESGLLGMLLYISLFVLAIVSLVRTDLPLSQKALLIGLFAAYAIHNIFVFDVLPSYMLFAIMLAFTASLREGNAYSWLDKKINLSSENFAITRDYAVFPVLGILLITTIYFINVRPIQANTRLIAALQSCSGQQGVPSIDPYVSALSLNQTVANQEIREQLYTCAGSVIGSSLPNNVKADFYNLVTKETAEQIKASPNDARVYLFAGTFYDNVKDFKTATSYLEKAHELSPAKQSIDFELAANYMNIGRAADAATLMQKAYESAPDNGDAKVGYIAALVLSGNEKKAQDLFANEPELFADQRVINVYLVMKQYGKVISILKAMIAKNPDNEQYYETLTLTYLQENDLSSAAQEIKVIEEKFPLSKAQLDPILKMIESGKNPLGAQQ